MAIAKKIISYILAIVFSICVIIAVLLICINNSLFSKTYIKKELRNTDYYYYVYSIIEESCNNTFLQSGFESKVFDNVITEKEVQEDIDNLIDCLYDNKKVDISTDSIKQTLNENIQKEIEERNYVVSEETQSDINEFVNTILDTYKNHIIYSQEVVDQISQYLKKVTDIAKIAMIVLSVTTLVLAVIIFILNRPSLGVGLFISGIFFIIVKVYSGVNVAINNVLILNWAFSKTMTYILNQLLKNLFTTGIMLTIAGIIIIIVEEIAKIYKLNQKSLEKKSKI